VVISVPIAHAIPARTSEARVRVQKEWREVEVDIITSPVIRFGVKQAWFDV
jgi:hypothetical protein